MCHAFAAHNRCSDEEENAQMVRRLQRDARQFAVWDYDPGVLAATSCATSVGALVSAGLILFAEDAMSGSGGSALQRYLHAALLLVHSLLCGGTVMVLRMAVIPARASTMPWTPTSMV